jgi:hypothetical protein
MGDQEKLKAGLIQVIRSQRCSDEHIFFQLFGAGLVKRVASNVIPRNSLYAAYFKERLNA